ncbi:adenosylcobinamide kinase /adenosylcobinamide-phosphate guanylyltransferase [Chitinophaga sp. CF118]|uniref:bifunctional adenosylcobinamide kinase/adenosylcobinamide-phosphate guanylyltransferase n=1 Tax=Chitinophaga sp. CF118 TaxID=1884367 RepID=UPI0008EB818B|nr:bifunctional adenosylcobinamide kinase/adenosylcobinamide-phosphate guanylyltransferase [Chitinophaga sp. CF118]SFD48501.1 adenosylcobinamide kinase /adenosylcobinamide-phosphate guanylyltransferase [Chitinophaga sp. CF118]
MIYYISGGQRSGKTNYALQLALSLSDKPVYLATSRIWDDDHKTRIERHKGERDQSWESIEEEKELSRLDLKNKTVVLDCVTLWLTNFYTDTNHDIASSLQQAKQEFDLFIQQEMNLIVISNEIGMGTHATTDMGRKFADLQGWMNQHIAQKADTATFMVSGIPVKIK